MHPVRQLLSKPQIYEYATPITGTYPPGYDWSYWMEGARPRFQLKGQLRVLRQSFGTFFQIFLAQLEYGVALLFLIFLARGKRGGALHLPLLWYLWLPALLACASYAIVLVEFRYVAPFVLLLWLASFSSLLTPASGTPSRVMTALVLAVLSVTGLRIAKSAVSDVAGSLSQQQNVDWEVVQGLQAFGLQPHDRVSVLSQTGNLHWARAAGVTIVSEIPLGEEATFWTMDAAGKDRVFQVLAGTGARIVVAKDPPPCATKEGWVPLARTGFYVYRLPIQNLHGRLGHGYLP